MNPVIVSTHKLYDKIGKLAVKCNLVFIEVNPRHAQFFIRSADNKVTRYDSSWGRVKGIGKYVKAYICADYQSKDTLFPNQSLCIFTPTEGERVAFKYTGEGYGFEGIDLETGESGVWSVSRCCLVVLEGKNFTEEQIKMIEDVSYKDHQDVYLEVETLYELNGKYKQVPHESPCNIVHAIKQDYKGHVIWHTLNEQYKELYKLAIKKLSDLTYKELSDFVKQ